MPAKPKPIKAFNSDLGKTLYFKKAKDAGKYLSCNPSVISKVCKGKLKSSWGWEFEYIKEYIPEEKFVTEEQLSSPLKYEKSRTPWNKDTGKTPVKSPKVRRTTPCKNCNLDFHSRKKSQKFCGVKCKGEYQAQILKENQYKYDSEARSKTMRRMWEDKREEILEKRDTPEYRNKLSKSTLERFEDPEFAEKHREAVKNSFTPERRKALSEKMIERLKKGNRVTKPAIIVMDLLKSLSIDYEAEFTVESKYGWKSYDIALPEHGILIEVMGDYFHCNPKIYDLPKNDNQVSNIENDKIKKKIVDEELKDHKLIYLWESDIYLSPKKCINYILSTIHGEDFTYYKDPSTSDYEIRKIEDKDKILKFLDKYHYIGGKFIVITRAYGLYLNGSLMGVVTYNTPSSKGADNILGGPGLELTRFCLINHLPKNTATWFMSRTIKYIKEEFKDIKGLVSYADSKMHTGTIYKAANWKSDGQTKGRYYYETENGDTVSRRTVYKSAKKFSMTEREYTQRLNLRKVETSYKLKFYYLF